MSENFSCIESDQQLYLPTYPNATFVQFHTFLENYESETESENYLKTMKSGQVMLNTHKTFDINFMGDYLESIEGGLVYRAKTFSEFEIPFLTQNANDSNFVVVDYQCSTLDINYYLEEFQRHLDVLNIEGYYTFGSYIVLVVVILVAGNFRKTINGKSVLIYSIIQTMFYAQYFIPNEIFLANGIITCVTFELECFAFMWLAIISYDYLKTIRSNVSVQLSNINQKNQILKYSIIGFLAPFLIATGFLTYMGFYYNQKSIVYIIGLLFLLVLKISTGIFFIIFLITWRIKLVERADIEKMNACGPTETKLEKFVYLIIFMSLILN